MFLQGDKYIHFTKYGGVNKGEVESCGTQINWDTDNMVAYYKPYVKTTVGHIIHTDGTDGHIYKIKDDITKEMLEKLKSSATVFEELKNRKENHKKIKTVEPLSESTIKKINKQIDERSI